MITTVSLVDIHYYTVYTFFLAMRTFKTNSLNDFQIYNKLLLNIVTMLYPHAGIIKLLETENLLYNWHTKQFILIDFYFCISGHL